MRPATPRFLTFTLITLLAFMAGCLSGGDKSAEQPRKQVYIDANLQFEIVYPEAWARARRPVTLRPLDRLTSTWQLDTLDGEQVRLTLSVTSIPARQNPHGYAGLATLLREQYPAHTFGEETPLVLATGPARHLTGQSPDTTLEAWLLLGEGRQYMIVCSAASRHFEQLRPQFEQVVASFRPL